MAVSHWCVPKSMVCTSEKLWFGFAPPTMKIFPLSASPTGGKYEQLWPTRGQGLSPGQVKVYHVAFLGLSPGSKMGSCFMMPNGPAECRSEGQTNEERELKESWADEAHKRARLMTTGSAQSLEGPAWRGLS